MELIIRLQIQNSCWLELRVRARARTIVGKTPRAKRDEKPLGWVGKTPRAKRDEKPLGWVGKTPRAKRDEKPLGWVGKTPRAKRDETPLRDAAFFRWGNLYPTLMFVELFLYGVICNGVIVTPK